MERLRPRILLVLLLLLLSPRHLLDTLPSHSHSTNFTHTSIHRSKSTHTAYPPNQRCSNSPNSSTASTPSGSSPNSSSSSSASSPAPSARSSCSPTKSFSASARARISWRVAKKLPGWRRRVRGCGGAGEDGGAWWGWRMRRRGWWRMRRREEGWSLSRISRGRWACGMGLWRVGVMGRFRCDWGGRGRDGRRRGCGFLLVVGMLRGWSGARTRDFGTFRWLLYVFAPGVSHWLKQGNTIISMHGTNIPA